MGFSQISQSPCAETEARRSPIMWAHNIMGRIMAHRDVHDTHAAHAYSQIRAMY